MDYHVVILSADEIFSRMLELEMLHCGLRVLSLRDANSFFETELLLLDLDSVTAPVKGSYQSAIGFTGSDVLTANETRRNCSMILHRPFEISRLRQEVLSVFRPNGEERAVSARSHGTARRKQTAHDGLFLQESELCFRDKKVALSPAERAIMQRFLEKRGEVISKEELSSLIGESSANKTEVYVCYLRRKMETLSEKRFLKTVRGQGYRLEE